MNRNKYSDEYIKWLFKYAPVHTKQQTIDASFKKFGYKISNNSMTNILYKRGIRCKDYNQNKNHPTNIRPIGTEYIKPDGMILLKISSNEWEYKQRYLYEQYHNVKLPKDVMVIFLDGDRNNFDISNLRAVTTPQYNTARNKHLITNIKEVTDAGLDVAQLYCEIKKEDK